MDHDQWGALALFVIATLMLLPGIIDIIRKNKIEENDK